MHRAQKDGQSRPGALGQIALSALYQTGCLDLVRAVFLRLVYLSRHARGGERRVRVRVCVCVRVRMCKWVYVF